MSEPREEPAIGPMGTPNRPLWGAFLGLAAGVLVLDQLTKAWLVSFLAPGESVDVVGDLVRLVHSRNAGGLFGFLQGQALPFALVSMVVVALIVMAWLMWKIWRRVGRVRGQRTTADRGASP